MKKLHKTQALIVILSAFFSIIFFSMASSAQRMVYALPEKNDNSSMQFEILGKSGNGYCIYKNISKQHLLCQYNRSLELQSSHALEFIPEKIIDLDFIPIKDGYALLYQFQTNKTVHCVAVKIDSFGVPVSPPKEINATALSFFADKKIYSTAYSENKKRILLYKRSVKNDVFNFSAFWLNAELQVTDSFSVEKPIRKNEEYYGDCVINNSGDIAFTHELHRADEDDVFGLDVCVRKSGSPDISTISIPLDGNWMAQPMLRADNINNRFLVITFFREARRSHVRGIFSAFVGDDHIYSSGFNPFFETMNSIENAYAYRNLNLDNLSPKQVILKRSGGFIIISEDTYTETYYNNSWSRDGYYSPYSAYNDYYLYNNYNNAYRPFNGYNNFQSTRYYANDILILSVDSVSRLEWNSIINKKQYSAEDQNCLSFSILNAGKEIHFFYINNDTQKEIVNHLGIQSNGKLARYPTLKNNGTLLEFMPKLAKQTGPYEMIMPFIYLNKIGFAKIDYSAP